MAINEIDLLSYLEQKYDMIWWDAFTNTTTTTTTTDADADAASYSTSSISIYNTTVRLCSAWSD
jgi:hypothetical protein